MINLVSSKLFVDCLGVSLAMVLVLTFVDLLIHSIKLAAESILQSLPVCVM